MPTYETREQINYTLLRENFEVFLLNARVAG